MAQTLPARLVTWLILHPRAVLAGCAILTLGAILLLFRLRIDPDVSSLVRGDDPTLRLTRHLLGEAPLSRTLVVILRAERPEQIASVLPSLVDRLRISPFLKRVIATRVEFAGPRLDWMSQAPLYALPPETLDRLKARLAGSERRSEVEAGARRIGEDPLSGKAIFLRDPLSVRWIFDEAAEQASNRFAARLQSGTPYLIFADPPVAFIRGIGGDDSFNLEFTRGLMGDVERRVKESLGEGPVRAELAGGYVTATAQETIMRRDIEIQFISSVVAVVGFLVWFTRSLLQPHLVFLPVVLAIIWGLGIGSALLGPLTPIALSMAAIVAGLGSDYPIYLLSRFRAERATQGRDDAILRTQLSLGRPFVSTATTTMGGFLVLIFSGYHGLRQFGLLVFLGYTLSVVISLLLFPILLLWIDRRLRPGVVERIPWAIRLAQANCGRSTLAIVLLLLGVAAWGGVAFGRIPLDLDLRNTMAPGDPGQKALERLEADLGIAMGPVFALIDRSVPLEEVRTKVDALRAQGTIAYGDGPQELIPSVPARERVERFLRETAGWVEQTLGDLALLGYRTEPFRKGLTELQRVLAAPPPGVETLERPEFAALKNSVAHERQWVVWLWPRRSLWLSQERERFNAAVRERMGEVPLLSAYHVPDSQASGIRNDLTWIGGLAVLAIIVLTIFSVWSLKDGILALVPVLIATGITLAVCSFLGGAIKSMNLAAIPIVLGIGVDGGIHYMASLRARGGKDPAGAIGEMGPGYWVATVTTVLGFGSIAFSSTPGLSFLGVLVIVGMAASFAATLFLLPALAALCDRIRPVGKG